MRYCSEAFAFPLPRKVALSLYGESVAVTIHPAIRDPDHEEHESLLRRAGGTFDPEAFDIDRVNRRLSWFVTRPSRRSSR